MDVLRAYMSNFKINNQSTIPFIGGGVGTVGYDIVRQFEKLPNPNKDSINVPDVHLMFAKEMIAYDHFHQQIFLMVLEEDSKEGSQKAERLIHLMEEEIKKEEVLEVAAELDTSFRNLTSNMTKEEYVQKVEAKQYIREGDIFK